MTPGIWIALLALLPVMAFAGPAQIASESASPGFQPQVMPQVVAPDPAAAPPVPGSPIVGEGDAPDVGVKVASPESANSAEGAQEQNPIQNVLSSLLNSIGSGAPGSSPAPPANTNWSTYSYPDDYRFNYGGQGVGNIGNGLCTNKNKERTQVRQGYCETLYSILNSESTCAGQRLSEIVDAAGSDGSGIGQLLEFCPTYGKLTSRTQRIMVFQQILATLITQESGWNPNAEERPWTRDDGASMGGKGLFQIGVGDASKPDCAGVKDNIFNPRNNMLCGACIALTGLRRDKTIGRGTNDSGSRGMAWYFGPLRDQQQAKRQAMANAVAEYCRANTGDGGSATDFAPYTSTSLTSPAESGGETTPPASGAPTTK